MKKMISAVAMMAVLGMLVGCGSANGDSFAGTPEKQVVSPILSGSPAVVADSPTAVPATPAMTTGYIPAPREEVSEIPTAIPATGIAIAIGEEVTVPIIVDASDCFSGFTVAVGHDAKKVEVTSITGASGEIRFDGIMIGLPIYEAKERGAKYYDSVDALAQKNADKGLATSTVAGISFGATKIGKVALFSITFKGKATGKTEIFPELYGKKLLKSVIVDVIVEKKKVKSIEEISFVGEFEEIPTITVK